MGNTECSWRANQTRAGAVEVALLLERRYLTQRQPQGLASELRRHGCAVRVEDPGSGAAQLMGYMSAGEDAGEMAGPVLAGLLWGAFGAPVLLATRIGLALVAEVFTWRMTHDLKDEPTARRSVPDTEHAAELGAQVRASANPP